MSTSATQGGLIIIITCNRSAIIDVINERRLNFNFLLSSEMTSIEGLNFKAKFVNCNRLMYDFGLYVNHR